MNSHLIPENHRVTAKFMAGEEASAIVEAACVDNLGARVEDHGSYLSISNEQRLDFNIPTIVEELGRPYDVPALLVVLFRRSRVGQRPFIHQGSVRELRFPQRAERGIYA